VTCSVGFDSTAAAQEAFIAAQRLNTEGTLLLRDAVFVVREGKKARVIETMDPAPGQSAISGGFWGLLFGNLLFVPVAGLVIGAATSALDAKFVDVGVSDSFIEDLRKQIEPGKTYLALLVSHVNAEKAREELTRFAGIAPLISGSMPAKALERARELLDTGVTAGDEEDLPAS